MEILHDFGVQPILLLAQIVNFAILVFVLQRLLYKPILKVLEERRKKVDLSIKQAEKIAKDYEESHKKQQEILDQAKAEASEILGQAKEEAIKLREDMLSQTKLDVESSIKRGQEILNLERERMINLAKKDLAGIILNTTEKVTGKVLSGEDKNRLVEDSLKEL